MDANRESAYLEYRLHIGVPVSRWPRTVKTFRDAGYLSGARHVARRVADLPRGDAGEQTRQGIEVPRDGVICTRDKKYLLPIGRG